jgi:transcriptional regulator with XRE-family HTH domain
MKIKSFQKYLETRLDKNKIREIEKQAEIEFQSLKNLRLEISEVIIEYVKKEKIGFNELVRRLGMSPTQVQKIQKGKANLTLATLAHIGALLKKRPHIYFDHKNK